MQPFDLSIFLVLFIILKLRSSFIGFGINYILINKIIKNEKIDEMKNKICIRIFTVKVFFTAMKHILRLFTSILPDYFLQSSDTTHN
jgi:uncharacterized membrane protein